MSNNRTKDHSAICQVIFIISTITIAILTPFALACVELDQVDLFVGISDANAMNDGVTSVSIPVGNTAYFYSPVTVEDTDSVGDAFELKWRFDYLDGCPRENYSKSHSGGSSSTIEKFYSVSHVYDDIGTFDPNVLVTLVPASGDPNTDMTATATITSVGVASVEAEGVTSTSDNDPCYVYVARGFSKDPSDSADEDDYILVTATEDPSGSAWPVGYPKWKENGVYQSAAAGDSDYKFRINNASSSKDGTLVTAECGTSSKSIRIVVVDVNIQMQSLGEEKDIYGNPVTGPNELSPGAFIGVNDDDDNSNGTPDHDDPNVLPSDNDLKPATLTITPSDLDVGEIVLSPSTGSTIKVYEDPNKAPGTKYSWDLSSETLPGSVYVEGCAGGAENLTMSFVHDGSTLDTDEVKINVLKCDITFGSLPDANELEPGGFIGLNDDNDDFDDVMDLIDGSNLDSGDPNDDVNDSEDDLVSLSASFDISSLEEGTVVLVANSKMKLWIDSKKVSEPNQTSYDLSDADDVAELEYVLNNGLYVEGVSSGISAIYFVYYRTIIGTVHQDRIKVNVIDVDITEPSGSSDWGLNPASSWETTNDLYRFDFQGVIDSEPCTVDLTISGSIVPTTFTYHWTLDSACGTLSDTTVASPTHTSPSAAGTGTLKLEAYYNGSPTGIFEKRELIIYEKHLYRDKANFGTGGPCSERNTGVNWKVKAFNLWPPQAMSHWNCHGGSQHAYNGTGDGSPTNASFISSWATVDVNGVDELAYPFSAAVQTAINAMNEGDVVGYYCTAHASHGPGHTATSLGGATTWGANNDAMILDTSTGRWKESWIWQQTSVSSCASDLNAHWPSAFPGNPPWTPPWTMDYIMIHQHP